MATGDPWSSITKLKGAVNYRTWSVAIRAMLEVTGLHKYIIPGEESATDTEKAMKAKARLLLSVEESLYVHIEDKESASEIWKTLQDMFAGQGTTHKIGLIQNLINVRLENSESMTEYVGKITSAANKLNDVGFKIDDELVGAIMLAGLPDDFRPMILGFEGSGIKTNSSMVKSKLLYGSYQKEVANAFLSKQRSGYPKKLLTKNADKSQSIGSGKSADTKKNRKDIKCYYCDKRGHKISECRLKQKADKADTSQPKEKSQAKENSSAFSAVFLSKERSQVKQNWYIDSGASQHMTSRDDWFEQSKQAPINEILTASNSKLTVSKMGNMTLEVHDHRLELNNVLHVPGLSANLLSVAQLIQDGNIVKFDDGGCSDK